MISHAQSSYDHAVNRSFHQYQQVWFTPRVASGYTTPDNSRPTADSGRTSLALPLPLAALVIPSPPLFSPSMDTPRSVTRQRNVSTISRHEEAEAIPHCVQGINRRRSKALVTMLLFLEGHDSSCHVYHCSIHRRKY